MKLSRREQVLMLITLAVVLGGLSYGLVAPVFGRWKQLNDEAAALRHEMELNTKIIERRAMWDQRYAERAGEVPRYASRSVAPELLKAVRELAERHGVSLLRIEPGRETQSGELYELSIPCSWEAELEALTRMLFDLQQMENRFDVHSLTVSPQKDGRLKGGMNIYCAYYKVGEPAAEQEP
jgi:hypothetical protein